MTVLKIKIINLSIILLTVLLFSSPIASSQTSSDQISSISSNLPSQGPVFYSTGFEKPGETLNTSSADTSSSSGSSSTTTYIPPPEGVEWYNYSSNPLGENDRNCAFYDNGEENSLIGIDYNFDLPAAASFQGIEVLVAHAPWNIGNNANLSIELFWNNRETFTSTGYFDYVDGSYSGASWNFKNVTFGSDLDTWGHDWTLDDFSNENFGVRLVCTDFIGSESVDFAWVNIHYILEPAVQIDQLAEVTFEYDKLETATLNWTVYLYDPYDTWMKENASSEFWINGLRYTFNETGMDIFLNESLIVLDSSSVLYNDQGEAIDIFQIEYQPGVYNFTLFVSWEDNTEVYEVHRSCTIMVTITAPPVTEFPITGLVLLGIVAIPLITRRKK
jgi:hypothetical protein